MNKRVVAIGLILILALVFVIPKLFTGNQIRNFTSGLQTAEPSVSSGLVSTGPTADSGFWSEEAVAGLGLGDDLQGWDCTGPIIQITEGQPAVNINNAQILIYTISQTNVNFKVNAQLTGSLQLLDWVTLLTPPHRIIDIQKPAYQGSVGWAKICEGVYPTKPPVIVAPSKPVPKDSDIQLREGCDSGAECSDCDNKEGCDAIGCAWDDAVGCYPTEGALGPGDDTLREPCSPPGENCGECNNEASCEANDCNWGGISGVCTNPAIGKPKPVECEFGKSCIVSGEARVVFRNSWEHPPGGMKLSYIGNDVVRFEYNGEQTTNLKEGSSYEISEGGKTGVLLIQEIGPDYAKVKMVHEREFAEQFKGACNKAGRTFSQGSKVGNKVCSDGEWVKPILKKEGGFLGFFKRIFGGSDDEDLEAGFGLGDDILIRGCYKGAAGGYSCSFCDTKIICGQASGCDWVTYTNLETGESKSRCEPIGVGGSGGGGFAG